MLLFALNMYDFNLFLCNFFFDEMMLDIDCFVLACRMGFLINLVALRLLQKKGAGLVVLMFNSSLVHIFSFAASVSDRYLISVNEVAIVG